MSCKRVSSSFPINASKEAEGENVCTRSPSCSNSESSSSRLIFCSLIRTYSGEGSTEAFAICMAISLPYCITHCVMIHSGIEYTIDKCRMGSFKISGYTIASFVREMVRSTPFTNPDNLEKPCCFASFTVSLQAAESGTDERYRIW